jgi:glutathione synthase/RimK-type ligase-like ATP-grasp enzyme
MKIAIHDSPYEFHPRWIEYCENNGIEYVVVNCYENNIISSLKDCDVLMWQFHQGNPKDILMAKQLMFSLQQSGKIVFPNFNTSWHFDDKLGQKYLLESYATELAQVWVFYDSSVAINWLKSSSYPKVFKLRGGAGSQNVRLVKTKEQGIKLVKRAFGKGFSNYNAWGSLKERYRLFKLGKAEFIEVIKGVVRLFVYPEFTKTAGVESGYIYFQEYYPNNDSDSRIVVVDNKAFALKRMVRKNDFRASGSGNIKYGKEEIDIRCVKSALKLSSSLEAQCLAFDYIFDTNQDPILIEISFGFHADSYDDCEGYWDEKLQWHAGRFNPYGWMIESVIRDHFIKTKVN